MHNLPQNKLHRLALILLAIFFILGGVNHFRNPKFYLDMMPSYLPAHQALVDISGIFEILGGLGVLYAPTRRWAGWGLILLLIAIFPANIEMALNHENFTHVAPPPLLYARLPIQFLLIAWVYYSTGLNKQSGKQSQK